MLSKKLGLVVACMLPVMAWASGNWDREQANCERYPHASYDGTFCYSRLLIDTDKQLNQVYQALRNQVGSNTRQELTQTQRAWMQYRNNVCQNQPGTILVDCNYRVNRDRVYYLRDRLRECQTGQCRHSLIVRESW